MEKLGDITVVVGEYEKDGQTKRKYATIGALFKGDKGYSLKLSRHINLAGCPDKDNSGEVWGNVYDNKDKQAAKPNDKAMQGPLDDEVPF